MPFVEAEIHAMTDAESAAGSARDAEALVNLFHTDMVRPWPPTAVAYGPMLWEMPYGKFDRVDGRLLGRVRSTVTTSYTTSVKPGAW